MRIVKVFWGLDSALAYRRHFPAINWLRSYSLYKDRLEPWYLSNLGQDWIDRMAETLRILQIEAELDEIVKLVGIDALSSDDRLIMETARSIREDFLQQDSFDPEDSYCSLKKQYSLIKLILSFHDKAKAAVDAGADLEKVVTLPVREKIGRAKTLSNFETDYPAISAELDSELEALAAEAR